MSAYSRNCCPSGRAFVPLFLVLLVTDFAVESFSAATLRPRFSQYCDASRKEAWPCSPKSPLLRRPTFLRGLLDELNSDAFDLTSSSTDDESDINMNDAYEMFLADLVFSANDPRVDIMNKFELAGDPKFTNFLEEKIANSRDPEERTALRDLFDMIKDITTRLKVNELADERRQKQEAEEEEKRLAAETAPVDNQEPVSTSDILQKAAAIDAATAGDTSGGAGDAGTESAKESFYESALTPEIRLSYENLLSQVMPPYKAGDDFKSVVRSYYEQFDAQFVKVLTERVNNGDLDAKSLLQALAEEQQARLAAATKMLQSVLALGDPRRMEGALVKMAREGQIDEAFLLLLEANENQARQAGANGPADVMKRLRARAAMEKDKQSSSKEIRLLRQLLRTDDTAEREKLLEDAFTPKEALIVPGTAENAAKAADGEAPDQQQPLPEVPPPDFINACKAVLLNFGNLGSYDADRGDLATRIKKLAAEAEVVATRIYGKGMTLREQQDRMWKDQTTSIFDLERMEIEAERNGETAPWANPDGDDDMFMPGFDKDGRMQVGGS